MTIQFSACPIVYNGKPALMVRSFLTDPDDIKELIRRLLEEDRVPIDGNIVLMNRPKTILRVKALSKEHPGVFV